jgi:anti-sigma B factor antagonist
MRNTGNNKMQIEKTSEGSKLTLKVSGRLDTNTSPDLEAALKLDGVTNVVFDFTNLEYISSAGLRILLSTQKAMMACGGEMSVANPNAMVSGVFDMTGLSSVLRIV